MIDEITPERIANAIMQDITYTGSNLLVEGNSDYIFFRKFVDSENCQIIIAQGKRNVLEAISILNIRSYSRALGVVDSDFYKIDPFPITENVVLTDYHDIEMMSISSPSFNTIIDVYTKPVKVRNIEIEKNDSLVNIILNLARPIGFLKLANIRYDLGLSFKAKEINGNDLDYSKFININDLNYIGDKSLIETVINYSRNRTKKVLSLEGIFEKFQEVYNDEIDNKDLCNGHDVSHILSIACRRKLNNSNAGLCSKGDIERSLILAYDSVHFKLSNLYNDIKRWEISNSAIVLII